MGVSVAEQVDELENAVGNLRHRCRDSSIDNPLGLIKEIAQANDAQHVVQIVHDRERTHPTFQNQVPRLIGRRICCNGKDIPGHHLRTARHVVDPVKGGHFGPSDEPRKVIAPDVEDLPAFCDGHVDVGIGDTLSQLGWHVSRAMGAGRQRLWQMWIVMTGQPVKAQTQHDHRQ